MAHVFLGKPIGSDENNLFFHNEDCGRHSFGRFVGAKRGVACLGTKLELHTKIRNLNLKSQPSSF